MVLFDTHVWVWVIEGDARRIGRRARKLLERAESDAQIRVSPVSIFEVAALHTAGRLQLASSVEQWSRDALAAPGVRLAELTPAIAIDAGTIPRSALPDPLDRLLFATARHVGATLMTADQLMLDYAARTGSARVHDVRT